VVKLKGSEGGPETLAELREMLGVKTPDLNAVSTELDEKKYKIGG
jgi:hypothetical protein